MLIGRLPMMKFIYFLAMLLLYAMSAKSQWLQLPFPSSADIRGSAFSNADTGYAATPLSLYRTTNGGNSWNLVANAPTRHQFYDICVPKFGDKRFVYAVGGFLNFDFGTQTQEVRSVFLRSTNYGQTWTQTIDAIGYGPSRMEYVYFVKDSVGFVKGSQGPFINNNSFKKTTNQGQNWVSMTGVAGDVFGGSEIDFVSERVGYTGNTFKTSDQGANWSNISFVNNIFPAVSFINEQVGYLGYELIVRTSDGGVSWTRLDTIREGRDMMFSDSIAGEETVGYVVGDSGSIYKNTDGFTFKKVASGTAQLLYGINVLSNKLNYIFGTNRTLLKTTNGGVSAAASDRSKKVMSFQLGQNYPNPYNPSTAIEYDIGEVSEVRLSVYDILGRKVSELVNSRQAAGRYRLNFNGSQLSSGVYFYRIEAGSYRETKKMVLIK
jgi:photosystem II stability/assembly factor-like uncharacterized protein